MSEDKDTKQLLADANANLNRAVVSARRRLSIYRGFDSASNEIEQWHLNAHTCARHLEAVLNFLEDVERLEQLDALEVVQ